MRETHNMLRNFPRTGVNRLHQVQETDCTVNMKYLLDFKQNKSSNLDKTSKPKHMLELLPYF